MADYYLKNPTAATISIDDLGFIIAAGQSTTIDQNDIDGYLSQNMIDGLNAGLVLSTTDIGSTIGDFPTNIAIERLTLKSQWRPKVATFAALPIIGNDDGDIRLVTNTGVLYMWSQIQAQWDKVTSNFSLIVEDYMENNVGTEIQKIVFVQAEDDVYIDQNSKIAYIGPPNAPLSLQSQSLLVAGTNFYTGRLSQGNINYNVGDVAGTQVNYITNDSVFSITTPTGQYSNQGDAGTICIYLNGTKKATIDLAANFNSALNNGNQNISTYNTKGTGDTIVNGRVTMADSYFEVMSVGCYNSFKFFQVWQARFVITSASLLRQGWNELHITHEGIASGVQTSQIINVFYDNDSGANPAVSGLSVVEKTPVLRWLSGVKFYDGNSTFNVDLTINNGFNNAYHSSNAPAQLSGWPGMSPLNLPYNDSSVSGVSTPPLIGENMVIDNWQLVQAAGVMSEDAILTATPQDPYGTYTSLQSASHGIMVYSVVPSSTPLIEYFRDEAYRLPEGNYNTIPASIVGMWDSTQNLGVYESGDGLQVYMDQLVFPTRDFTNTLPSGNPNYQPLAAGLNKVYYRAFKSTTLSRAQGTLRITGLSVAQMQSKAVDVFIKVPSQTGWLSLNTDYNFATFNGTLDGTGCWIGRLDQQNSDFQFNLDQYRTEFGGYMIIVKIVMPTNAGINISQMEITDWT
jgi:hypothetical protein